MDYYKFFEYLRDKRKKKIPLIARLIYTPESVTEKEIIKLDERDICNILLDHPDLIKNFDSYNILSKLGYLSINWIIFRHPSLRYYFKKHGLYSGSAWH